MIRGTIGRGVRSLIALGLAQLLLPHLAFASEPSAFEIGIAARESGHLRGLVEKLAKQNVLYQFHMGGVSKQEMHETASQIDRIIYTLEKGSAAYSVAPPITRPIEKQLSVLDGHWSALRRIALASPYDYIRLRDDTYPSQTRRGDPFRIRSFDRRAGGMIEEATRLMQMYQSECHALEGEFCAAAGQSGYFNTRVERIAKELVLLYADIDTEAGLETMRASRNEFDASLSALARSPILTRAMDSTRGKSAEFVRRLWDSVQDGWGKLRFEADLALEDRVDGLDIRRMLRVQRALVDDLDRLRAALSRYAQSVME